MIKRTCTIDGCNRAHAARGHCKAHYNKLLDTNRHAKKLTPCTWCGTEVLKGSGGGRKYGAVCSDQCRQYLATPYCVLPADHWARWYGKSSKYPPRKPCSPFAPEERNCEWCGISFTAHRADHIRCSRQCKDKAKRARRRASECNATGTYTWIEVIRIWAAIDKCCAYCNEPSIDIEPDHVIALSRGGSNSITNVVPSCKQCNSDKRDLSLSEWYQDRARRHLPQRTLNPRLTHLTHALLPA